MAPRSINLLLSKCLIIDLIGYLQNSDMNDSHDLLEKFTLKIRFLMTRIKSDSNRFHLTEKLQECILKNEKHFHFLKRFPDFHVNWDNTPVTFSVMIELAKSKKELIAIESSE
jgi:hypothetical protein